MKTRNSVLVRRLGSGKRDVVDRKAGEELWIRKHGTEVGTDPVSQTRKQGRNCVLLGVEK